MAHPFYRALKLAYPNSEIHFLAAEPLESFDDKKFCEKKYIIKREAKRPGKSFFALAKQLKNEKRRTRTRTFCM